MEKLLFDYLLPQSAAGALAVVLLLAAGRISGRLLSRRCLRLLWLLAPLLFLLPVRLPALPFEQSALPQAIRTEGLLQVPYGMANTLFAAQPSSTVWSILAGMRMLLAGGWLLGVLLFLGWHLAELGHFAWMVRRSAQPASAREQALLEEELAARPLRLPCRVRLLRCPGAGGPLLYGLLRPTILLPAGGLEEGQLRLALRHELTHLRQGDLWYKLGMLCAAAVHWFNPLAHLMLRQADRLCEYACDEAVLCGCTEAARRAYGLALLETLQSNAPAGLSSSFRSGADQMKRRLELMIQIPRSHSLRVLCALLVTSALCSASVTAACAFGTAARPEHGSDDLAAGDGISAGMDANAPAGPGNEPGELQEILLAKPEETVLLQPEVAVEWRSPVAADTPVSAGYGERGHEGIDFAAQSGASICAAASGTVVSAGWSGGYGNCVTLSHGDGLQTLYAHCSELLVREGEQVAAGQEIARVGATGWATGPNCHFAVLLNGEPQDPAALLP